MADKIVRRTLADGTVKEYAYKRKSGPAPRSIGALIAEYKAASEYVDLKSRTKRWVNRVLDLIGEYEDVPITDLKRRHILQQRDKVAIKKEDGHGGPAAANQLVGLYSKLMQFAVEREYRQDNPATKIKRLHQGEWNAWSKQALAFALETFPEQFRRAIVLALYTGQREYDVLTMRWSDFDGSSISIVQQKTGAKLRVPCHRVLLAELSTWKSTATTMTILATARGKPWVDKTFSTLFAREARKYTEMDGCVFHGLRKLAAARLAEAGCSTLEIMSITGHITLDMVEHYTKQAEQEGRAVAAIHKLENKNGK